jgi:pimeloyl-ACP methyl ester carboxylesterase
MRDEIDLKDRSRPKRAKGPALVRAAMPGAVGRAEPAPTPFRTRDFLSISRQRFHRIAYTEWGDPDSERVVVCVHGLTRQGRDFDPLAAVLAGRGYRVVCPDLVGRGRSGRLRDPDDYALPQYVVDMTTLVARLGVRHVDWIGTSLGGFIGLIMAGMADSPIRSLLINDIGPFVPWAALRRIGDYLRVAPRGFPDMEAAEAYFREILAPFGALTDAQWRHLTVHSVTPGPSGGLVLHYDPGIAQAFRPGRVYNVSLWSYWDAIACPVLVLRGETSDLLPVGIALEMTRRGPNAGLIEIPGCGHAPALLDDGQIALVSDWLVRVSGA